MPTAQPRPITRTLRFRLMVWNAFVVILTGVVTLVGLREGVRFTLIRELDQLLAEDISEIQLSLADIGLSKLELLREQLDRKAQGHARHKWFAHLFDDQGQILCTSANAPPLATFTHKLSGPSPRTIGPWRVFRQPASHDGKTVIMVGSSLELIQQDIARLDRALVIAICVILLAAPACGYWLAGRATRPLAEIISRMSQVRPANLDERLPLRGTMDELDQLSATFNRMLDRIGDYVQDRRDFLANAAHELRTPLAAIRSSVEVALASDRTAREYEELLNQIIEESSALELLVNQLLLLAESETERLKLFKEIVRLDELVEKAVEMFEGVSEFRGIQLECAVLPRLDVEGNRQHLRQVVFNLIDNAIKFTATGGRVHIDLSSDESSREAVFRIEDTGVGIPADDLPHVFDRFFRGDRARRRDNDTRGTGLGLSICHAIVTAHLGTIHIESSHGVGTRVTVRLPLAASNLAPTDARKVESAHTHGSNS